MTAVRMPPEWAPQSFVLMAWPFPESDFGPWLEEVEACFGSIAAVISQFQPVLILFREAWQRRVILQRLPKHKALTRNVRMLQMAYDDVWVRDTAPLTVLKHHRPLLVDFRFNGWGHKYPCQKDKILGQALYRAGIFGDTPCRSVDWVLEGGSIETDGKGTLLATRRSILNLNRNHAPQENVSQGRGFYDTSSGEAVLKRYLGFQRFLWLDHGYLEGDDTDAHIDTLARFCGPDSIAHTACDNPGDCHYGALQAMARQLAGFKTAAGTPYRLFPLPLPGPIYDEHGRRLPANYANFLIINGAVLVPVYNDPADRIALIQMKRCFPDRKIVPMPARPLIYQYGSLHCMTMHYPLPVPWEVGP